MANLKEIRNRITSVSSTMQITSAMKMVSAAAKESTRCDYSHASHAEN
jgi:F0F1-type ATP synthase gamma subunit